MHCVYYTYVHIYIYVYMYFLSTTIYSTSVYIYVGGPGMGIPKNGRFIMENPKIKWMMARGTPPC